MNKMIKLSKSQIKQQLADLKRQLAWSEKEQREYLVFIQRIKLEIKKLEKL